MNILSRIREYWTYKGRLYTPEDRSQASYYNGPTVCVFYLEQYHQRSNSEAEISVDKKMMGCGPEA
jgi:hypothetical protein